MKLVFLHLHCDEQNQDLIQYLSSVAEKEEQVDTFEKIYPWRQKCDSKQILYIYIAVHDEINEKHLSVDILKMKPFFILGWMSVTFIYRKKKNSKSSSKSSKNKSNRKSNKRTTLQIAHVNELSTSRRVEFRGIGTMLINQLKLENIDFIELIPLDSAVGFYKKQGFIFYPSSKYMFFIKESPPSKKYIQYLYQRSIQGRKDEKEDLYEQLEDIKSQLNEEEIEILENMLEEDEVALYTILDIYENSDNDIEEIINYLYKLS